MLNFEPQEKYLAWVPQGKAMFSQYGLCGQELVSRKSQRKTLSKRLEKQKQFYSLSHAEESCIIDYYENKGFNLSGICCLPHGHQGKCKNNPWQLKKIANDPANELIQSGFVQKITAGSTNDGGDWGAMNRAGNRWWAIQANKLVRSIVKDAIKKAGVKSDQSIFVLQNLASGPYMAVLANFDMLAQCSQVDGFYDYIDVDEGLKLILKQRFNDLVKYYADRNIKISTKDGKPKCPLTHVAFEKSMFGQGSDDEYGVQFGHVEPKVFDEYMTKPYNVCLITRKGNAWQGDRSIADTFDDMRQALAEQDK
jgi:hypothetical protein